MYFFGKPSCWEYLSNKNSKNCTINLWNSKNINKYDPYLLQYFKIPIISFKEFENIDKILNNNTLISKYQHTPENRDNILKHFFGSNYETCNCTNQIINYLNCNSI